MRSLLLILALVCGSAHATLPPCWPSNIGGAGTAVVSGGDSTGQWFGWWCPDDTRYGVVALTNYTLKHPPGPHASALDMVAAYWALNVMPRDAWTDGMRALNAAMYAALADSRPAAKVWKVAPNGTATTRPAYPVVGGVIGTKEAGRAPVGHPCDCSTPIKRSTVTYCVAPGLPALVTVCRSS